MNYLYPWTHPDLVAANEFLHHKAPFLNMPFFLIRQVIYFLIWIGIGLRINRWYDEQDRTGEFGIARANPRFQCALSFAVRHCATFAYIDWLLSADAQYYSTVYGGMVLIGDVVQTFALTNLTLILLLEVIVLGVVSMALFCMILGT